MNAIKKLSGKDLTKLIDEAAKELTQRKRMDALSKDIQRVIAKHKVSKTELAKLNRYDSERNKSFEKNEDACCFKGACEVQKPEWSRDLDGPWSGAELGFRDL